MRFKQDGSNWRYLALLTVTYRYLALDAVGAALSGADGVLRCFRWNERWQIGRGNSPSPRPSPKGRGRIVRGGLGKLAQFGYARSNRRGKTMLRSRASIPLKTAKNQRWAVVSPATDFGETCGVS